MPAADRRDRERVNVVVARLAQEDTAGVELMAAKLGHEPAAGFAVEPPAHELV